MSISEKAQQIEIWDFFMNDQNIMLGYTHPMEKIENFQSNSFWCMFIFYGPLSTWGI